MFPLFLRKDQNRPVAHNLGFVHDINPATSCRVNIISIKRLSRFGDGL
jgi:hypothetical protein